MTAMILGIVRLGDVIAAIFDEAACYSSDPKEVARLATLVVKRLALPQGEPSAEFPVIASEPSVSFRQPLEPARRLLCS